MKVSVYVLPGGTIDIMVEASVGNRKPPVLIRGVTRDDLVARVAPVVAFQRGRKEPETGVGPS